MIRRAPSILVVGVILGLVCSCSTSTREEEIRDSGVSAPPDAQELPDVQERPDSAPPDSGTIADDAGGASLDAGFIDSGEPPKWSACDTAAWPAGYPTPPAQTQCTAIEVPLDHAEPASTKLSLRVARQPSRASPPQGLVFVLEGGPGGSSVFTSGLVSGAMPDLADRFDVVYVDQRGTGGSGYLACTTSPRTTQEWIDCAGEHTTTNLDHYLSADVARDLEIIRERLGTEEVSLFAVSYGTRIGFEYLRLFGDRVVAAVFDGVAPPNADLFSDSTTAFDRGIDLLVADCVQDPACLTVSPTLEADLATRRQTLRSTPRPVVLNGMTVHETEQDYVSLLRAFTRESYWRYRVPRAVHQAVELQNHTLWNALMSEALGTRVTDATGTPPIRGDSVDPLAWGTPFGSPVVKMAMLCAEMFPNAPGILALETLYAEQTWPSSSIISKANACPSWPVSPLEAMLRQPVTSDVKILLLSGAVDINVDPMWAWDAEQHLSQATHIVVPFATHLATYVPCVGGINTAFLAARGDLSRVDTTCIDRLVTPTW